MQEQQAQAIEMSAPCARKELARYQKIFYSFDVLRNRAPVVRRLIRPFRNQPEQQLPMILFTTLNTAREFPTQNDSEFIIVSLTGRPHYKSRVVFGHHLPKTTGTMRASPIASFW